MLAPINTLLIDGSFDELAEEFAQYLDDIRKKGGNEDANTKGEIAPAIERGNKEEVLKKLVVAASALNHAPEKGMSDMYIRLRNCRTDTRTRIHSSLQSSHTSHSTSSQTRNVLVEDMSIPLTANHILTIQWNESFSISSHHGIQHPRIRRRRPVSHLPRHS